MIEVEKFVERSKLSQREAAKILGITQPRLNDLVQGKIQKFSIDSLVKMLSKVGIHVDVHVSAAWEMIGISEFIAGFQIIDPIDQGTFHGNLV